MLCITYYSYERHFTYDIDPGPVRRRPGPVRLRRADPPGISCEFLIHNNPGVII